MNQADGGLIDAQAIADLLLCPAGTKDLGDELLPVFHGGSQNALPHIVPHEPPHPQAPHDMRMGKKGRTPFGQRMYEARRDAGLTQVQAAKKAGVDQSTVSLAETTAFHSKHTGALAAVYKADAVYLATGKVSPGRLAPGLSRWAIELGQELDTWPEDERESVLDYCRGAMGLLRIQRGDEGSRASRPTGSPKPDPGKPRVRPR